MRPIRWIGITLLGCALALPLSLPQTFAGNSPLFVKEAMATQPAKQEKKIAKAEKKTEKKAERKAGKKMAQTDKKKHTKAKNKKKAPKGLTA